MPRTRLWALALVLASWVSGGQAMGRPQPSQSSKITTPRPQWSTHKPTLPRGRAVRGGSLASLGASLGGGGGGGGGGGHIGAPLKTDGAGLSIVVTLGVAQLRLLEHVVTVLPELAPGVTRMPDGRRRLAARGTRLSRDSYLAPHALAKLRRQIFMLHSLGISHNAIVPENLVVTPHGELRLVGGWEASRYGGSIARDLAGLARVRAFVSN